MFQMGDHYERLSTPPTSPPSPPPSSNSLSEVPFAAALSYKNLTVLFRSRRQRRRETTEPAFIQKTDSADSKMKMPQILVLLVTILMHAAAGFPTDRRARDKHASWDDVNVVAHGLLQLGQGLKEHVDKTKAQMRDVSAKLKAFNGTVAELERRQQEQGEALEAQGKKAEERERLVTELVRMKAEEAKKQSEDIHSRMDRLEEKVDGVLTETTLDSNNSDHTQVPFIQRLVAAQNRRIDQLVEKIQQQQDKLEKQSLHLQALQSMVAHKRVKSHRRRDEEMALRGEAALSKDTTGKRTKRKKKVKKEKIKPMHPPLPTSDRGLDLAADIKRAEHLS
ncbi:hypothetical protein L3Q82_025644, partial [Scortum barcoo]